jgi:sugar phosphate isomerase/epimerase
VITRRALLVGAAAAPLASGGDPSRPGLELYSLRYIAEKDFPSALDTARRLGFRELEAGDFYGRSAAQFGDLVSARGLRIVSMVAAWKALAKSTADVARDAGRLGSRYVTCTSAPGSARNGRTMTLDDARRAADAFNRWGRELRRSGLRLCFHPHGPEFVAGPDGTLFDSIARAMDPQAANFEMDVFWFVFGNQNPAEHLRRYKGRFLLMHLKDIRPGVRRTFDPATVAEEDSVPIGTGEVDWQSTLQAARESGVQEYFIEEEHPRAVPQIKESLRYLASVQR